MVSVGLFLTNQQPEHRDLVAGLAEQLALVRAARNGGLDSVFAGQHHLSQSLAHIQPLPYLGRVAAETGDMRLGIGVHLLALHNPVDTAESYASLDVVTGGRSVFGVGLGYREAEYRAFGISPTQKVRRFERNLELVAQLWAGEEVSCEEPWVQLDRARLTFLPAATPRPPIWMAANSDRAVCRAARMADTWIINPHATFATIERQLVMFRKEREAAGRGDPEELPLIREVFCAATRERALALARPHLKTKYDIYADWGQDQVMPDKASFRVAFDELRHDRFIIGTPEDCLHALLPWRDNLGVNHFLFRTDWAGMPVEDSLASLKLLTTEVVPTLRETDKAS